MMLCGVALVTTSCEWMRWLRLLSFKKQLAEVERYARIEEKDGLRIRLLKPVVYADDLHLLIEGETLRTTNQNRVTWMWSYEKHSLTGKPEPAELALNFTMLFENLKLCELQFDRHFLGLMPKPLILGLMRSVGQAQIDMKHGTVKTKWVGPGPNQKVELPTKSQIVALLGAPFRSTETNGAQTFLYKYYQKAPNPQPPAETLAWANFTFANGSEQVDSSEGMIGNVGWSMTRVPPEPEPRITFSLMPLSVEPVALKLPPEMADAFVGQYTATNGTTLNIGRDADAFVASWVKDQSGGWCLALPELTNILFALPSGSPRWKLVRDNDGIVTGLVAEEEGRETLFAKCQDCVPSEPTAKRIAPKVSEALIGRYKGSWGSLVTISREGEQLFWQNEGIKARVPLYPSSETEFFFKAVESPLTFVKNSQGEVTKFILHYHGHNPEAVKVKER